MRCYAYEEIFAEKIRALAERARPRDLYDVINLYRQRDFQPSAAAVLDILAKKSAFKNMPRTCAFRGGEPTMRGPRL